MTKYHLAALRTQPSDGTPSGFVVAYLFAHLKPSAYRTAYDDLIALAGQDYPDHACATMASGIQVNVTAEEILPEHWRIASCSLDFSLLKTGWRYSSAGYFVHPIPIGALAEVAHAALLALTGNKGVPDFCNHPAISESKLEERMLAFGPNIPLPTGPLIETAKALLPIFRRGGKWAEAAEY
jgi:hypothetical protein